MKYDKQHFFPILFFIFLLLSVVTALIAFKPWNAHNTSVNSGEVADASPSDEILASPSLERTKVKSRRSTQFAFLPKHHDPVRTLLKANAEKAQRKLQKEKVARGDQPDEAARFRRMQMQDEKGEIPIDGLQKAKKQMDRMRAAYQKHAQAAGKPDGIEVAGLEPGDWTSLGPGNVGGRIRSIVIDPNSANKMWVGSAGGGIWFSTNAGSSWSPVNDFLANLAVSTLVINPTNSNVMYAGTGESFAANLNVNEGQGSPDGLRGLGVFQSTDAGVTWTQLASTNPAVPANCAAGPGVACPWSYVNRLAMSPDGSTILAATSTNIWRSADAGTTWTQGAGVAGPVLDMDFDPANNQLAVAGGNGAAAFTTNGGQNWTIANFNPAVGGRVELAYAPSNPSIVYAAASANNGDLYRSTNGGQNYTRVNTGTNFFLGANNQGGYDNIIWVNPQDPTFVVVGGIDLWRSTDCGTINAGTGLVQCNFTQISRWQCGPGQSTGCAGQSAHADHHAIVAHPGFDNATNKLVYFGNDGGLFSVNDVSTVGQTSGWTILNNNLGVTQFYSGTVSANGDIFGGTQDNGTLKADIVSNFDPPYDPQAWVTPVNGGGDGGFVAADPTDGNYLYGEQQNMQLFRSSDGGETVNSINAGITETANANFIAPFILDPNNPNTMLAGSLSLWRSIDVKTAAAPTWIAIKPPNATIPPPPPPNPTPTPAPNPISAIAVSPTSSNFIVVGHNDGQIFMTLDGTGTNPPVSPAWSRISNATTPNRFVTRLAIDNTKSPNWIYATFGGFQNNNVYVTRDLGTTWIDVSGATGTATDLPAVPIRSILINPANGSFLYVGTEVGIFASEDSGATWQLPQDGPANVSVDELFFYQGDLMAATHGRGIYTTRAPVYDLPACAFTGEPGGGCPSPSVRCMGGCCVPGDWNCPCTWNNRQIPTQDDDVVVTCPITVSSGTSAGARNITVNGRLSLAGGSVAAAGDVVNFGLIEAAGGFSSNLSCNNLLNVRPDNAVTLRGIISLNQPLFVRGDIANYGLLMGPGIELNGPAGAIQNLSGTGEWNNSFLRIHRTAQLSGDVTLDVGSVIVQPFGRLNLNNKTLTVNSDSFGSSGTVDLGTGTLNFNGNQFQSTDPTNGDANFGVKGTGTVNLSPTGGTADFFVTGGPGTFQPSLSIRSGTVDSVFRGFIDGSFTVDPGARFNLNEGSMTVNGGVAVSGTLAKSNSFTATSLNFNGATFENNGSVLVDFITFNFPSAPRTQTITGTGSWSGTSFGMGASTTINLANDITFGQSQFGVPNNGSVLNLGNTTLTYRGSNFATGPGGVIGTGTLRMQPAGGTASLSGTGTDPIRTGVTIASGTVTPNTRVSGPFTIDPGATLSGGGFHYIGNTFTNNGSVAGTSLSFGSANFSPINQQLGGTGTFSGSTQLFVRPESTISLSSDLTFAGSRLFLEGRINTGTFTFSMPCTTALEGPGEVVGNFRRTNLAACPGAVFAFGNPFTTIQFTSGTPPTELTFNLSLAAPVGFPGAVRRTYFITPVGGSGYTATLRLHYLDSELNGNNESTMQLWRHNGSNWTAEGVSNRNTTQNWVEYSNVTQFSPWAITSNAPTAAPVSISGRVQTADGRGIRNAVLTLTADDGSVRSARTNTFGYYQFERVAAGETYIVGVAAKRYTFAQPSQVVAVFDQITDLDFIADASP